MGNKLERLERYAIHKQREELLKKEEELLQKDDQIKILEEKSKKEEEERKKIDEEKKELEEKNIERKLLIEDLTRKAETYRRRRVWIIINNIIQLILFIVGAISLLMAKEKSEFIYKYSEAIKNNNEESLILIDSIKIIDSNEFCEDSYEAIKLGEWSGNEEGCYGNGTFYVGKCKKDHLIPKTLKRSIYNYRGKKICKSIKNKTSYRDIFDKIHPSKCPENEIDCGEIDTLHQHYCVKSINECPINYYKFNKEIPTELKGKNYFSFDFGDNIKLFITNEMGSEGKIISQFQISDSIPCNEPQLFTSYNKEKYIFENYASINACNDTRYEKDIIDSYSKELIHKENLIYPMYYPYNGTISNLYGVLYYGYSVSKDKSKQIMNQKSFDNYVSTLQKTKSINENIIWVLGLISAVDICLSIKALYQIIQTLFSDASFFGLLLVLLAR